MHKQNKMKPGKISPMATTHTKLRHKFTAEAIKLSAEIKKPKIQEQGVVKIIREYTIKSRYAK